MSEIEYPHTTGSSGQGLTFIRPLPQAAPPTGEGDRSHPRLELANLMDRLFPPRSAEESGSAPPVTGLQLGHFIIEERIGRGGMGAVFRALDSRLGRVVAVKVLSPEHSADPESVLRFQNEARAAAKLDHDNIARVHYIGEEHGLHFIAFEFVTGTNVRNVIVERGKLPPSDAVNYTLQIAEALRHTAAANVVHRDIKPSNIIISPTGRAKLVDLGLARQANSEISRELTVAGTALGTFDYIAPEQAIDARNVDVRSDIYSLGCTLYHMLTGEPPYPKGTMFEKVMNHHRPVPPDPASKNQRVSPQLSRIVQQMMASNPDERYSSPDRLIEDLVQVAETMGLEPAYPETVVWAAPSFPGRSARWEGLRIWAGVSLVLLLLVFLIDRFPVGMPGRRNLAPQEQVSLNQSVDAPQSFDDPVVNQSADQGAAAGTPGRNPSDESRPLVPVAEKTPEIAAVVPETPLPSTERPTGRAALTGSAGTSSDSTSSTSATRPVESPAVTSAGPPAERSPYVVLTSSGTERGAFSTLAGACSAAEENDAIEIRGDGPMLVQKTPQIVNKRIAIRPAPGSRPTLRFDVMDNLGMGALSRMVQMIHLERGALTIYDLHLELIVKPDSTSDWAIVTLANGSELQARGVSFTVVNPGRVSAMVIDVPEADDNEILNRMPDRMTPIQPSVQMTECICRGEADFVSQQETSLMSYSLDNVAFALSGALFRIDGSNSYAMVMGSDEDRATSIELKHVTALSSEGLLVASSGDGGSLPRIKIIASDSIFRIDSLGRSLIAISGHEEEEVLLDKLSFQQRGANFFQLTGPLSSVESETPLFGVPRGNASEFLGISSNQIVETDLLNLEPLSSETRMHLIRPVDLMLRSHRENPALSASSDRLDAGVNWTLQRLPQELPDRPDET